jgi:hypothetical protein
MTKIEYVAHEKNGVSYISLAPVAKRSAARIKVLDALLIATCLAATAGLLVLLVR